MEKIEQTMDRTRWDELAARYFEAQTTPEEERMLRRFLASPAGADARFDALRAVMGYVAVGRSLSRPKRAARRRLPDARLWRAVAAVCIVAGIGAAVGVGHYRRENICVAYVAGHKETSPEAVMQYMETAFSQTVGDETAPTMEEQLGRMFNVLENP